MGANSKVFDHLSMAGQLTTTAILQMKWEIGQGTEVCFSGESGFGLAGAESCQGALKKMFLAEEDQVQMQA